MNKLKKTTNKSDKLRRAAEMLLKKKKQDPQAPATEPNTSKLIHELEVHQIELEMQNEELIKAREKAELAEKKYTELYNFAPTGYLTLTKEGKISELNFSAALLLGKERSYLIKKRFALFVSDDTRAVFNTFVQSIYQHKSKRSCEVMLLSNENSAKHALMKGIISNADENCLVTLVDITDLKMAEAEINKANEALIELNAEKDKFFSIIAHDLRGPISSFMELTRFISEELSDLTTSDIKRLTNSMMRSARKLYGLLENLLQWAKLHQNLLPFNPKLVQLRSLVNESLETIMESASNKEIVITNTIPGETALWADSGMLQSVIRNLVTNAVKFTPKGGEITLSAKTTEGKSVEISVKDTGIGIDPERIKNLFQLNQQMNRKGTEGEPSSGLGLILCKEFVEKHGGKIRVESEEGKGSTFFVTIPFKKNS